MFLEGLPLGRVCLGHFPQSMMVQHKIKFGVEKLTPCYKAPD